MAKLIFVIFALLLIAITLNGQAVSSNDKIYEQEKKIANVIDTMIEQVKSKEMRFKNAAIMFENMCTFGELRKQEMNEKLNKFIMKVNNSEIDTHDCNNELELFKRITQQALSDISACVEEIIKSNTVTVEDVIVKVNSNINFLNNLKNKASDCVKNVIDDNSGNAAENCLVDISRQLQLKNIATYLMIPKMSFDVGNANVYNFPPECAAVDAKYLYKTYTNTMLKVDQCLGLNTSF